MRCPHCRKEIGDGREEDLMAYHLPSCSSEMAKAIRKAWLEGCPENLLVCENCGEDIKDLDPGRGKDGIYRMGEILFDPGDPGNREEPPEPASIAFVCCKCIEEIKRGRDAWKDN